ncbi:glucosyltransferase domain-containing protein [Treponema sp.]|uniref:glucosyltransferase domain-containing protein n=1 Tax=Treponema sp. TaxID=166 RepID=UPI00298E02B8|nr:glucosyltransferase domain-containing protein [Treponema sp.]MCQ2241398.1 glucosyltransferase domain-containing protein [Treponema sp.]
MQKIDNKYNFDIFRFIAIISLIFFVIAHGYLFFNSLYSHDSLLIYQDDFAWQISLGRFFQPLYLKFRGGITSPVLIGVLSYFFTLGFIVLTCNIFSFQDRLSCFFYSGVIVLSTSFILANATYIPWSDIYMLSLLLAGFGAYLLIRKENVLSYILAIISFIISLGLYQAYIQVAVLILFIEVFSFLLDDSISSKKLYRKILKFLSSLLISFILYLILFRCVLRFTNITAHNGYNGPAGLGNFGSIHNFLIYFAGIYKYVFKYLLNPIGTHIRLTSVLYFLLLIASGVTLVLRIKGKSYSKVHIFLLIISLLIFPLSFNFIYLMTKGMIHELMTYSFTIVQCIPLVLLIGCDCTKIKKICLYCIFCIYGMLIFDKLIFSNQCYLKKDLEQKSTLSIVTRIIDRIEQTDGYKQFETPVVFIGSIEKNPTLIKKRSGFNYRGGGNNGWSTVTYSLYAYLDRYLSYPIVRVFSEVPDFIYSELTVFPDRSCSKVIDGVLYIKLSEYP